MVRVEISRASREGFLRYLSRYQEHVGKAVETSFRELAAVGARELAYYTEPRKLTAAVGKKYAGNIAKQIFKAIRKGNVEGTPGDAPAVHGHYRNARGRVNFIGEAPSGQFKRRPVDKAQVHRLIAEKVALAGSAKGAWIAAGEDLGLGQINKIPKWLRSRTKRGDAQVIIRGASSTVILRNDVDYCANLITPNNIKKAIESAYRKQRKRMIIEIEKASGGGYIDTRRGGRGKWTPQMEAALFQ
jgi:hypothetical protein